LLSNTLSLGPATLNKRGDSPVTQAARADADVYRGEAKRLGKVGHLPLDFVELIDIPLQLCKHSPDIFYDGRVQGWRRRP
jgi:hypothetical protein